MLSMSRALTEPARKQASKSTHQRPGQGRAGDRWRGAAESKGPIEKAKNKKRSHRWETQLFCNFGRWWGRVRSPKTKKGKTLSKRLSDDGQPGGCCSGPENRAPHRSTVEKGKKVCWPGHVRSLCLPFVLSLSGAQSDPVRPLPNDPACPLPGYVHLSFILCFLVAL